MKKYGLMWKNSDILNFQTQSILLVTRVNFFFTESGLFLDKTDLIGNIIIFMCVYSYIFYLF